MVCWFWAAWVGLARRDIVCGRQLEEGAKENREEEQIIIIRDHDFNHRVAVGSLLWPEAATVDYGRGAGTLVQFYMSVKTEGLTRLNVRYPGPEIVCSR